MSKLIEQALGARRESKRVEFKEKFSSDKRGWCELLKDVFALSNSGGGIILFGVDNTGTPTGVVQTGILNLDPADFTNKVQSYTSHNFSDFEIFEAKKDGVEVACADAPIAGDPSITYNSADRRHDGYSDNASGAALDVSGRSGTQ